LKLLAGPRLQVKLGGVFIFRISRHNSPDSAVDQSAETYCHPIKVSKAQLLGAGQTTQRCSQRGQRGRQFSVSLDIYQLGSQDFPVLKERALGMCPPKINRQNPHLRASFPVPCSRAIQALPNRIPVLPP
jgi:hypothetical protein